MEISAKNVVFLFFRGKKQISPLCPPLEKLCKIPPMFPMEKILPTPMVSREVRFTTVKVRVNRKKRTTLRTGLLTVPHSRKKATIKLRSWNVNPFTWEVGRVLRTGTKHRHKQPFNFASKIIWNDVANKILKKRLAGTGSIFTNILYFTSKLCNQHTSDGNEHFDLQINVKRYVYESAKKWINHKTCL